MNDLDLLEQVKNNWAQIIKDLDGINTDNFFSRIHSNNTTASGGEFDDIVVWIPLNTLMSRMVAAGKLP